MLTKQYLEQDLREPNTNNRIDQVQNAIPCIGSDWGGTYIDVAISSGGALVRTGVDYPRACFAPL